MWGPHPVMKAHKAAMRGSARIIAPADRGNQSVDEERLLSTISGSKVQNASPSIRGTGFRAFPTHRWGGSFATLKVRVVRSARPPHPAEPPQGLVPARIQSYGSTWPPDDRPLIPRICTRILRSSSKPLIERLRGHRHIRTCPVCNAWLQYEARKNTRVTEHSPGLQRFLGLIVGVPSDGAGTEHRGFIRAEFAREGARGGPCDPMIAATAQAT